MRIRSLAVYTSSVRSDLDFGSDNHSTAGKIGLGVITSAGDEALRSVLVFGATAVIQHVRRGARKSPWIVDLKMLIMTRTKDGQEFPGDYTSAKALERIAAALDRLDGAPRDLALSPVHTELP